AVTTLGVVESYQRSHSADEIARIVSRRTVYTQLQIEEMARTETTVMLFRLIRHFENVISFQRLRELGVARGPIQSIIGNADQSFPRILRAAER
ncbi:MAG: GNAT family N-acetyltransferase, partial [Candidatus Micrarchaeaceae archaeon]